jgi:adenine-specific DNA-methyltransferase
MEKTSLSNHEDIIRKLKEVIPRAFTDDKIDFELLKYLLGETVSADSERYELSWAGKAEAYKALQIPTFSILYPNMEASINWENSENIFIEGENLEALKVLQKTYEGKIKMIYIDPPYNTGSDNFIYPDRFTETKKGYLKRIGSNGTKDYFSQDDLFQTNKTENGQIHSNWLSMMLPRLCLARNLLKEEGVIFISIDDNEVSDLRLLLNEIFGEENFIASMMWRRRKTQANLSKFISPVHDYILCFAKNIEKLKFNKLEYSKEYVEKTFSNPDNDPRGIYQTRPLAQPDNSLNPKYELQLPNGRKITARWSCSNDTFDRYIHENRLFIPKGGEGMPRLKVFLSELDGLLPNTWLDDIATNEMGSKEIEQLFGSNAFFSAPKPTKLIMHLLKLGTDNEDIVLDFFAGSGTTAQAVLDLNKEDEGTRKFICIQLPEILGRHSLPYKKGYKTIADICLKRIQLVIENLNKSEVSPQKNNIGFRAFKLGSLLP